MSGREIKIAARCPIGRLKKSQIFLKGRSRNSGNRGVTQQTMKTKNADMSDRSQRELAAGVLKQAAWDLRRFRRAKSTIGRELYLDAYRWLTGDECSWPFSFLNVCQLLNLAPETVRQELIGDLSLGTFGYWTRRCGRAARRFRMSLIQLLASGRPGAIAGVPAGYGRTTTAFHEAAFVGGAFVT